MKTELESPGNWTEDFEHENGNYVCKCTICGELFLGHKRRVVCKECFEKMLPDPTSKPTSNPTRCTSKDLDDADESEAAKVRSKTVPNEEVK